MHALAYKNCSKHGGPFSKWHPGFASSFASRLLTLDFIKFLFNGIFDPRHGAKSKGRWSQGTGMKLSQMEGKVKVLLVSYCLQVSLKNQARLWDQLHALPNHHKGSPKFEWSCPFSWLPLAKSEWQKNIQWVEIRYSDTHKYIYVLNAWVFFVQVTTQPLSRTCQPLKETLPTCPGSWCRSSSSDSKFQGP